jgi:single-strand DNA-binding protein
MNHFNSILIEGNLVRKPILRSTPMETRVCTFSLASTFKDEVSFFNVETWDKLAETCYRLGNTGMGVRVVGRLREERWDCEDGAVLSKVSIVAEHVEFLKPKHEARMNTPVEEQGTK